MPAKPTLIAFLVSLSFLAHSQDSTKNPDKILDFPSRFFAKIDHTVASLDDRLTRQTEKYLQRLSKKEDKLKRKLTVIDSAAAKTLFAGDPGQRYSSFIQKLKSDSGTNDVMVSGEYMPYIDSLKGSLSFLNENPQMIASLKGSAASVQNSLKQLRELQAKMQDANQVKQYIQQRKEQIKQVLGKYTHLPAGLSKAYKDYSRQAYYYRQQVNEYRDILNDPDKMLTKTLQLLNKIPSFAGFMKKNSFLSALFNMPDNTSTAQAWTGGLQSRSQVMALIQNRVGVGPSNPMQLVQQNIQAAQGQIDVLRNKLNELGGGGDLSMPDFKPNNQRTKTFWKRLEYGTNLQTAHASNYFPTTTDMGLSVGFKLDDKNVAGIGMSYKMGWGRDIRHIDITSEGLGLRSFLDLKLKGSFYVSGGYEQNYQPAIVPVPSSTTGGGTNISEVGWQQSGLVGISKVVSMKTKLFKKSRLQLLWDFLSYSQRPQTQAFKFRIGYNF